MGKTNSTRKVPAWLAGELPHGVLTRALDAHANQSDPPAWAALTALCFLADDGVTALPRVRADHERDSASLGPRAFAQQVVFRIQHARDALLLLAPAALPAAATTVANTLQRLIDTTRDALDALSLPPLGALLVRPLGGPSDALAFRDGPWREPMERWQTALGDALGLATSFLSGTPGGNATPAAVPVRPEVVVLREGAPPTDRNIRLGRTASAYLEAHGNVREAMKALRRDGHAIGKSTFYDHLTALDTQSPGWRAGVLLSGASGNPDDVVRVRTRGK